MPDAIICPQVRMVTKTPQLIFVYYLIFQRIWDFEKEIITICWNDREAKRKDLEDSTELLVGTVDERVWNVALMSSEEAIFPPKKNPDSELLTVIKIEDDDKDIEEIELWNDEDGLLDGFDQLQDGAEPPSKRQRTGSSSSQKSPVMDKQQKSGVETIKISEYNNLVGSEVRQMRTVAALPAFAFLTSNTESFARLLTTFFYSTKPGLQRIAKAWDRLMVFRHDQDPIAWSSVNQFQPGHAVSKTLVTLDRPLGVATSTCLEQEAGLCVGTRDGLLWRFTASHHAGKSFKAVATCCKLIDVCWSA